MSSQSIRPQVATAYSGWTVVGAASIPEALDEETYNSDTDYASIQAATPVLRLDMQNHGIPDEGIFNSVTPGCYVRRVAGVVGALTLSVGVYIGSTFYVAATTNTASEVLYSSLSGVLALNPATGTAWTAASIRAAEWQFTASCAIPRATLRITQAWMAIDYTAPTWTQTMNHVS